MTEAADPATGRKLRDRLRTAPIVAETSLSASRMGDLLKSVPPESPLHALCADPPVWALLQALSDHAPFLWRLVAADPVRCASLLDAVPEAALERCLASLAQQLDIPDTTIESAMRALRLARQEVALLVALADLGGAWTLDEVVEALTRFADHAVEGALIVLVREAERRGKLRPGVETRTCGLVVLALGKGGGRELNYSSDIDLVVLFDPHSAALAETTVAAPFYVRLTQALARLLQERTADGFVVRVDLRLRPDPASTAVAIALPSAFSYYETLGQNWERAAFIKARPMSGDIALGTRFLAELAPFIWRKYFDFGAIADIHAMKRQIHAVRGQAQVAVAGHDLKLGRGGIREIEFFVQTQQLIFGGRRPALRGPQTCATLQALQADGWIDQTAVEDLTAAYRFLRVLEHRLQMIGDQQTQRLPADELDLQRFARFSGFEDARAFSAALLGHLHRVEHHYAHLFEHAPGLDTVAGSLVFTGTANDPETCGTLRVMGFTRPEDASELIRGWHFGRRSAVQSPRTREVLTDLVPALLTAFASAGDPDAALATFDTMLSRMSSATELLSLLRSNTALRELFADILGSAPRLAATVAQRPHVLDAAIDPALANETDAAMRARVAATLEGQGSTEEFLDRMRDLAQEEWFLIGVRMLSGAEEPFRSGLAYTRVADAMIDAALARCLSDLERDHGILRNAACAVLGMGKLGSKELSATSDLDLILIYRSDPDNPDSDGPRSLDASRYYTRLTQRLIAALTVPTRRGRLYDVDVRLRPSGRQGPVATRLSAFASYQAEEAQVWEHMALTRGRVVAGDPKLAGELAGVIDAVLRLPRSAASVWREIAAMRVLVAREKPDAGVWDMKLAPGGLLDIEFIAQGLVLIFAANHPTLCRAHPIAIVAEAASLGLISIEAGLVLEEAHRLQTALTQLIRTSVEEPFVPSPVKAGVSRRLCQAANQPGLSSLDSVLQTMRARVRVLFEAITSGSGI